MSAWSDNTEDDLDLDKAFIQDLRDLKYTLLGSKDYVAEHKESVGVVVCTFTVGVGCVSMHCWCWCVSIDCWHWL